MKGVFREIFMNSEERVGNCNVVDYSILILMNKIILLLAYVVLFASCNNASVSDKEVKINDKSEVFYKDGRVTEADCLG